MTVNELIEKLQRIDDKDRKVKLSINDEIFGDFHIQDNGVVNLYLSNYGEEGYFARALDY